MPDPSSALNPSDQQVVDSAIDDMLDPSDNQGADAPTVPANDTGSDTTPDDPTPSDDDPNPDEGLHPDALDPDDDTGSEPDLTDDDLKDSSRLKDRFKELTSKANRAKDLEAQNQQLLEEIETLKRQGADLQAQDTTPDAPQSSKKYTPEQLAIIKEMADELGYVSKDKVESLETTIKKLANTQASNQDREAMETAINQYTDKDGKPIVQEKHIKNAMRKWLASDDPSVRNRVKLDYPAIIQLIGGSKLSKAVSKKKPAPKVPTGGGDPSYKPEVPTDDLYDPGDPIGSQERMLARMLSV